MFIKLSLDQMQNFHDFHSGDPEGDVGEQLVEEAVDHRDDDDARPAALRHQLRHVLLHLHLLHRRPEYVESRDSTISNSRSDPSQSQSATLGMGAMNVAMTFVSLALIGELMVMMIYPPPIILIPITSPSYHHDPILIRESGAKGADGLRTQSHVVHDNSSPRQPPYFCESR